MCYTISFLSGLFLLLNFSIKEFVTEILFEKKQLIQEQKSIDPSIFLNATSIIQSKDDLKFCYPVCPINMAASNIKIDHDDFLLSYNISTKYADWVAYKININNLSGFLKKRIWKADPVLPVEIAILPSDYKGAARVCGYDKGHQAPLADFSKNLNWEQVNYLSNITPQKANLNRGAWADLENRIRVLAKESNSDIYVVTGPYYNAKPPTCKLPLARILNIVPNGYWKIITLIQDNNVYRASFKFSQDTPKYTNFCDYSIPVQRISEITKLNFNISDDIDNSQTLLKKLGCAGTLAVSEDEESSSSDLISN